MIWIVHTHQERVQSNYLFQEPGRTQSTAVVPHLQFLQSSQVGRLDNIASLAKHKQPSNINSNSCFVRFSLSELRVQNFADHPKVMGKQFC